MNATLLLALLIMSFTSAHALTKRKEDPDPPSTTTSAPPTPSSKSFFLFGGFFERIRRRWLGYNGPAPYGTGGPLFAGPAFPMYGYYNCPAYGCNPSMSYQPAPYERPNYYHYPPPANTYPAPNVQQMYPFQQQQQQMSQPQHQQSSVVIYQNRPDQQGYYQQPTGQNMSPVSSFPMPSTPAGPYKPLASGNGFQYPPYAVNFPASAPGFAHANAPPPPSGPGPLIGASAGTGPVIGPAPCTAQTYPCHAGKR